MKTDELFFWIGIVTGAIAGLNVGGAAMWKKMSDKMEDSKE